MASDQAEFAANLAGQARQPEAKQHSEDEAQCQALKAFGKIAEVGMDAVLVGMERGVVTVSGLLSLRCRS